eukprot:16300690-Heterocapsa_arctica.AAC.1
MMDGIMRATDIIMSGTRAHLLLDLGGPLLAGRSKGRCAFTLRGTGAHVLITMVFASGSSLRVRSTSAPRTLATPT